MTRLRTLDIRTLFKRTQIARIIRLAPNFFDLKYPLIAQCLCPFIESLACYS